MTDEIPHSDEARLSNSTLWGLDAKALSKWTSFAQQGGIGSCVAVEDFMATSSSDLMFLEGDEIVVLEKINEGEAYLGYCEGVVGRFNPDHVKFTSPIKPAPVDTLTAPTSADLGDSGMLTPTSLTFTAASPPTEPLDLPQDEASPRNISTLSMVDSLDAPSKDSKRVSGPFELDYASEGTPSPGLDSRDGWFAEQQTAGKITERVESPIADEVRNSTGSADWGGIGWMTGAANGGSSSDHAASPESEVNPFGNLVAAQSSSEPNRTLPIEHYSNNEQEDGNAREATAASPSPTSSRDRSLDKSPSSTLRTRSDDTIGEQHWDDEDELQEGDDEWDIYGDYARQSMYFAPGSPLAAIAAESKRLSMAQRRASRQATAASRANMVDMAPPSPKYVGGPKSATTPNGMQSLAGMLSPPSPDVSLSAREQPSPTTPELRQGRNVSPLPLRDTPGRSLASELRSRIQKERTQSPVDDDEALLKTPMPVSSYSPKSSPTSIPAAEASNLDSVKGSDVKTTSAPASSPSLTVNSPGSSKKAHRHLPAINTSTAVSPSPQATTQRSEIFQLTAASPSESPVDSTLVTPATSNANDIRPLGSPIPLSLPDEKQHYPAPPRRHLSPALPQSPLAGSYSSPRSPLASPSLGGLSTPTGTISTRIPPGHASPHSVDATQAAVTAARPKPDGQRVRGLTLVGRMEIDLTAAKGPMPISFLVDRPPPGEPTINVPSPAPLLVKPFVPDGLGLGLPESPGWGDEGPMPTSPRTPFEFPDASGSPVMGGARTPVRNLASPVPTASGSSSPVQRKSDGLPTRPRPRSRSFSGISVQRHSPIDDRPPLQSSLSNSVSMARSTSASAHPPNRSKLSLARNNSDAQSPPSPLHIKPLKPDPLGSEIPDSATLPTGLGAIPNAPASPAPNTPTTPASLADSRKGFWSSLGRREGSQTSAPKASANADMSPLDPTQSLPSPVTRSSTSSMLNKFSTSSSVVASTEGQPVPKVGATSRSASFSMSKPHLLVRKTKSQHFKDKSHISNLPSPVSHKDFEEETVKQDGMEFELMKPLARKQSMRVEDQSSMAAPSSPAESPSSPQESRPSLTRRLTTQSDLSKTSQARPLPETDEWGFLQESSPIPEILHSRSSAPGDHRAAEAKWLSIISVPLPAGAGAPKKVRKMVLEQGIPSSLRGRVWGWFMSASLSARVPGLYDQLLAHDKGRPTPDIDADVASCYKDHSVFVEEGGAGQQELRALLRAYAHFSPSGYKHEMALIAGGLLMHVPAEDAFWLLTGLVTRAKDYYSSDAWGLRLDTQVFTSILMGSDAKLAKFILKECGVKPISFLGPWLLSLFARILPWPTMLRVWDAVVCEGPRFLLQTSLAVLTISRDRLLALPKSADVVVDYLLHLPQDALLVPDNVMKASEQVKLRDEDLVKLRAGAEKVLREEGVPKVQT